MCNDLCFKTVFAKYIPAEKWSENGMPFDCLYICISFVNSIDGYYDKGLSKRVKIFSQNDNYLTSFTYKGDYSVFVTTVTNGSMKRQCIRVTITYSNKISDHFHVANLIDLKSNSSGIINLNYPWKEKAYHWRFDKLNANKVSLSTFEICSAFLTSSRSFMMEIN